MACASYINNAPITEEAKDRLQGIHNDIFSKAKKSQSFQVKEGKLFSPSIFRRGANAFIDTVNKAYSKRVADLTSNSFLTVNTLPLLQDVEILSKEDVYYSDDTTSQNVDQDNITETLDFGPSLEDEFYMNKSLYNHGSFGDYNKYRMLSQSTELVGSTKDSEDYQQYLEEQEMGDRNNFNFNCI